MANFPVNLEPCIPLGFDLEHWVRPARGTTLISGNPPRRHDDYAIAMLHPHPE